MKRNGTLHITVSDRGRYTAFWVPSGSPGGVRPHRALADEAHLKELLRALEICEAHTSETLKTLHDVLAGPKIHSIPEVWLSEEEARQQGLA